MNYRIHCLFAGLLLVGTNSCRPVPDASSVRPEPSKPRNQIDLLELDWAGTERLVAAHRGDVVVAEIWTTTCPTCVAGFPYLVDLYAKHSGRGLACISINCDYDGIQEKPPEFYRPQVRQFLEEQLARTATNSPAPSRGSAFEHVLLDLPLIDLLKQLDLGSTPAVLVYDRTGKLVRRFDNDNAVSEETEFTHSQVEALVEQLLLAGEAEKSPE